MSTRLRLENQLKELRAEADSLAIRVAECSFRISRVEAELAQVEDFELVDPPVAAPSVVRPKVKPSSSISVTDRVS